MKLKIIGTLLMLVQLTMAQTHIKVAGTKCSMIPPTGFVNSTTFSGFQNSETGASIMINQLPTNHLELIKGFTASALKTRGMTLLKQESIDFQNSKASIFYVSQSANGSIYLKQMLVFGDSENTILVNGIYPESAKNLEPEIKKAILSTIFTETDSENPLDAAPFSVNTEGTDFKIIKYFSGNLLYGVEGKIPTEKPTLIVGNSISKVALDIDQEQYVLDRLKILPNGSENKVKAKTEISIGGLEGYEVIAEGQSKDNVPELTYLTMLFNETGDYYIILGQTKEDFEKYSSIFKKIARSFKEKK
jgi:hypothetical protein